MMGVEATFPLLISCGQGRPPAASPAPSKGRPVKGGMVTYPQSLSPACALHATFAWVSVESPPLPILDEVLAAADGCWLAAGCCQ